MNTFLDSEEFDVQTKKAIAVGVSFPTDQLLYETETLEELKLLADTAGVEILECLTQKLTRPIASTFCGQGKVQEIRERVQLFNADLVVFDNELKPNQQRELQKAIGVRVIDRTELILLIFGQHAKTHQAKLAVDLARFQYLLPRLRHMWNHLERQRGGLGAVGGAGERQIETDRRIIKNRMQSIKTELQAIKTRRNTEVSRRNEHFQASFVGYTNAGKSTLMNLLTGADVYIADQLFATLDTRTRIWECNDHKILLSDTVGFIQKLPHSLIAGFQATLEEVVHADLLFHVVDISHPAAEHMIQTVETILEDLGAGETQTLLLLNKADKIKNSTEQKGLVKLYQNQYKDVFLVSALSGAGLTALRKRVSAILEEKEKTLTLEVSAGNGRLLSFLCEEGKILEQRYSGDTVFVRVRIQPRWLKHIQELNQAS